MGQEQEKLLNDIAQLRRDVDEGSLKQSDLERQIQESNEQISGLQEKINQIKTENMKEGKKRVCSLLFLNHFIDYLQLGTN
jgi:peptidoglycan hydrolase CwlO-like protein